MMLDNSKRLKSLNKRKNKKDNKSLRNKKND